jgi:cobalt/nickel transport protein
MRKIPILLLVAVSFFASTVAAEEWIGSDEKAEEVIGDIAPNYEPWFSPVFEPPSGEIESLLFSLQAAIGSLLLGYFIGYYRGAKYARNS